MPSPDEERAPLLQNGSGDHEDNQTQVVRFDKEDPENPRKWPLSRKYLQVFVIFLMAVLSPLSSSIFAPGIDQLAEDFGVGKVLMVGGQAGFVCMLGVGPLLLAPLSEIFGRRNLYLICFSIFTLLQIPTALSPNIVFFIVVRTLTGFFGSVGVANGGGSISDMFETSKRASVLGWYLLGPLLGPTLGPFFGGIMLSQLQWRWLFWILTIVSFLVTTFAYFFLQETYAPVLLQSRKAQLEQESEGGVDYKIEGESSGSSLEKIATASQRPLRILFTQPIVLIMSVYQAIVFSTMYSLYTNFQTVWGTEYDFSTLQVGLTYLAPTLGFIIGVLLIIPFIDRIYNGLAKRNENDGKPEYRLPLANVGAILLPISVFWFGWAVQDHRPWFTALSSTFFFGAAQVSIFNTVQNYYIDSFERYAASAIAAGAVLRSILGGLVPLFVPSIIDKLSWGWGMSVFGFLSLVAMPAPLAFYFYGGRLRERFAIDL